MVRSHGIASQMLEGVGGVTDVVTTPGVAWKSVKVWGARVCRAIPDKINCPELRLWE